MTRLERADGSAWPGLLACPMQHVRRKYWSDWCSKEEEDHAKAAIAAPALHLAGSSASLSRPLLPILPSPSFRTNHGHCLVSTFQLPYRHGSLISSPHGVALARAGGMVVSSDRQSLVRADIRMTCQRRVKWLVHGQVPPLIKRDGLHEADKCSRSSRAVGSEAPA